jgi:polygalacturonase
LDFGADDAANVNYNQGGTGSVNRTVLTKLQETVSVKDFGAVGDGVTDDTAAFNAAWSATDPQAVYVPAASYAITGTVTGKFFSFGVATVVGGTVTTITNLVP